MEKLIVQQSITIAAPISKVWEVLTDRDYNGQWAPEFVGGDGVFYIESDWLVGRSVAWKDINGEATVKGEVTKLEPQHFLQFTVYDAENGPSSDMDENDGITYTLTEQEGATTLAITQGDFGKMEDGQKYYDATVAIWERVLPKVKALAEQ